ncbi:MAG: 6-bladed beta-propeller [Gemmatimonadetes bacterium]|nr:6-bladed beta-propeller [Candidatus Palauibacter rhopaloidicola]
MANSGTGEIRVYSDTGQFMYAFGQMGEGPGEFRYLRSIEITEADSVMALDAEGGRISVFDEAGDYRRSFTVAVEDAHQQLGRMWIGPASEVFVTVTSGLDPREMTLARDSLRVLRMDAERADPEVLFSVGDMWWESSADATGFRLRAAGRGPAAAISSPSRSGTFAASSNDEPAIEIRDGRGKLLATWRDVDHPRGEASGAGAVQSLEEANGRGRFYAQLQWSTDGDHLWIGDAGLPDDETRVWTVVDREGRWVGRASLPRGATLWQIDRDFLLLKTIDGFGVERVEVWMQDGASTRE